MSRKYLIVNADDYGYYECVSKGILKGVKHGSITATGIMANSPKFDEYIEWLPEFKDLDKGVHLNISHGRPLTSELSIHLQKWNGSFPSKLQIVKLLLTGAMPVSSIEREWRAQIEKCMNSGVEISFLNSHEHLHMLPPLNKIYIKLVDEYRLIHSRNSTPEWTIPISLGSLFRNVSIGLMNLFNGYPKYLCPPKMLGMNESGNLTMAYLKKTFQSMQSDGVYELMCHPGYFDKNEISNPNLLNYHNWEGELGLLISDEFKQLCVSENIELISYRKFIELNLQ